MTDISLLRIAGTMCGMFFVVLAVGRLRRTSRDRARVKGFLSIGLLVLLVSLFPGLASLPAQALNIADVPGGRFVTLLLISTAIVWPWLIWERGKLSETRLRLQRFIIKITANTFNDPAKEGHIWVVIPAYNEEDNLRELLPKIPRTVDSTPCEVLVIDDGSSDGTPEVVRENGRRLVSMPLNCGGGMALLVGFHIATQRKAKAIVTMDGDCQHNPEEIAHVVEPILNDSADLVIGSRLLGDHETISFMRSVGLPFFNGIINRLQGIKNNRLFQRISRNQRGVAKKTPLDPGAVPYCGNDHPCRQARWPDR